MLHFSRRSSRIKSSSTDLVVSSQTILCSKETSKSFTNPDEDDVRMQNVYRPIYESELERTKRLQRAKIYWLNKKRSKRKAGTFHPSNDMNRDAIIELPNNVNQSSKLDVPRYVNGTVGEKPEQNAKKLHIWVFNDGTTVRKKC